jgi:hypothetical protein
MVEIPPTGRFDGRCVGTTEAAQRQPPSTAEVHVLRGLLEPLGSLSRDALGSNPSSAQGCHRRRHVSNQDHPSHETYPSPVFAARDDRRRDRRRPPSAIAGSQLRGTRQAGRIYHVDDTWAHRAPALRSARRGKRRLPFPIDVWHATSQRVRTRANPVANASALPAPFVRPPLTGRTTERPSTAGLSCTDLDECEQSGTGELLEGLVPFTGRAGSNPSGPHD